MANPLNQERVTTNLHQPAEWERHKSTWTAWPASGEYWLDQLSSAQQEFSSLVKCIAQSEPVNVLVASEDLLPQARKHLSHSNITLHVLPYGDIWLRDTGPVFVKSNEGIKACCYSFNGWGKKYIMPFDDEVSRRMATLTGYPTVDFPLVFEGGSIDVNGNGWGLTTRECLLNANRNPNLQKEEIVEYLKQSLGVKELIWLDRGLLNDHTDGHIDNIARFVGERRIVCMHASGTDDPNEDVFDEHYKVLTEYSDKMGFEVLRIPSPGRVVDEEGVIIPASHMNFYITNHVVVVPVYGTPYDDAAVQSLASLFPDRKTIGLRSNHIISGGGSFHCITQQEPI